MKRVLLKDKATPLARLDSLQNVLTGLGGAKDRLTGTRFIFTEIDKAQLDAAYRSDWIARKCVSIPAEDGTREWRSWESDDKEIEALEELEKKLMVQQKVKSAMTKARLYGGAALLIGVDGTAKLSEPLEPEKVVKDSLKFLHVVSRWELAAGEMDWDIESEFYGSPKYYMRAGGGSERIHPTRIVRFIGNEIPDPQMSIGWGDSILQAVNDAILAAGMTCASGAQLLNELKMDVIKVPNLTDSLANKAYSARLTERFGLANTAKGLYNLLLLDKDEEWERISANLTGLPDALRMYLLIASGAADIPATRMLGQSPAGLSATGESDLRNYYDSVKSSQTTQQQPAMMLLDEVIIRSALGTVEPGDVTFKWNPLWQTDDKDRATIQTSKANAFKADVDTGLIPSEVLRDARINQLIEDQVYPGLEQILDDYGDLEPIDDNPEPGAIAGPNGEMISPTDPRHPGQQQLQGPNGQKRLAGPATKKKAPPFLGDMSDRIRRADMRSRKYKLMDGVLRTLYVSRPVLNAKEIIAWAREQGIPSLEPAKELHVTIMYSRTPVDWAKTGSPYDEDQDGGVRIRPGGMRVVQKFGNAVVLCFNSQTLAWRHCDLGRVAGATYGFDEYQPHVTVAYIGTADEPFDPLSIEAYQGEILLGPEVYAEAKGSYVADASGNPYFDYNENHDPANGQFSEGPGGSSGAKEAKVGKIKAAKAAVKKALTKEGAKEALKTAVKVAGKNKAALANSAVQYALYHGAGVDYGPDIEKAIGHEIEHFAENAKIAVGKAKEFMVSSVKHLLRFARSTGHKADGITTDAEADEFIATCERVLKALEAYEPDEGTA